MKRKRNFSMIQEELASQSVFFGKNNTVKEGQKVKQENKEDHLQKNEVNHMIGDLSKYPIRRKKERHSFEFYADQLLALKAIKNKANQKGVKLSMSEMVRKAVDHYLEKKK